MEHYTGEKTMHESNDSEDLSCMEERVKMAVLVAIVIMVTIILFLIMLLIVRLLCHRRLSIRCVRTRQTEDVEEVNTFRSRCVNTISNGHFNQRHILTSEMVPYSSPVVDNPAYIEDAAECGHMVDDNVSLSLPLTRSDFELHEFDKDMVISKTITIDSKLVVYICRMIGSQGGVLELANMGISLFIPPGAIPNGRKEKIFLILDWDLSDFPEMTDLQTIISPVVHCGPHGLVLNKPAVLKYKHCAYDRNDIEVFSSETNLMHNKEWMKVPEQDNDKQYVLTSTECQIQITHFTLYTSIAQGSNTRKWLQIVAFAGPLRIGCHFQVRLYFLNNTPCALQFAKQNEEKQNFHQICPEKVFLFNGNQEDMLVHLNHKSEGWSCSNELTERVPYLSIWHGKCPHLSFIFKHENVNVPDISLCLKTYQKGCEDEFINFKILLSLPQNASSDTSLAPKPLMHLPENERRDSNGYHSQGNSPKIHRQTPESTTKIYINYSSMDNINVCTSPCTFEVIPYQLQIDLVKLLDPPCLFGKDWRIIASALDMDATIPLLMNQKSPTTILLQTLMQQDRSMDWLAEVLLKNDRLDAANVIMKVCKAQQEIDDDK
ncbi:UNC5C-like protein [Antedon mediterranea]|uniref:UNC5C-like protein n=1 Tax=Antedon mediterranea TaxID=105859 RepID=UPI003AF6CF3D